MRKRTWVWCAALLFSVACKKKPEDQPKKEEPAPKMVEPKKAEPMTTDVPVTSKSPDAVKAFEQGRDLVDNMRRGEATEHFKKAIELDPDFAQAHLYLGTVTPGAAGNEEISKAVALAAKLPEPEQKLITAFDAQRNGDRGKALAAFEDVIQKAPGAWRVDVMLANLAGAAGDPAQQIKRADHALAAKPDLPVAYNVKAYAHAALREWDQAIGAAKKQTELLPKEPNPQDTLGEVNLWAGKFEDAEKAFDAAIKLEPKFTIAWQGIALSRAYRGDFKGAYEALDKQKASTTPGEKYEAAGDTAWLSMAENKLPAATAALDTIEKDADAKNLPIYAYAAVERAHMLAQAGKYADAAKWYATALTRADALPGGAKMELMRGYRAGLLRLAAVSAKPAADTDKIIAAIDDDAKANADSKPVQNLAAAAHGYVAWAKKDFKGAAAELSKCEPNMVMCRFDLATAQRKAGDTAGAEATEKQIRETPRRESAVVYAWTHIPKK